MVLFVLLLLGAGPSGVELPTLESLADGEDPALEARVQYGRGAARFEAADYVGAIAIWSGLFTEMPAGGEFDAIRLDLRFNIAVAYERAFVQGGDVADLRQALMEFQRHAAAVPGGDAEAQVVRVAAMLAELEGRDEASRREPSVVSRRAADGGGRRGRASGIALVASGGAAVAAGIGLVVGGSRFDPSAQRQVAVLDAMDVPPDHASRAQAEAFVDAQRRTGRGLMVGGGVALAVGATAASVGIWALLRSKSRASDRGASWYLSPTGRGVSLGGRF